MIDILKAAVELTSSEDLNGGMVEPWDLEPVDLPWISCYTTGGNKEKDEDRFAKDENRLHNRACV
jgi:hypothetical protein